MPMHVGSLAYFTLPDDFADDFYEAFKNVHHACIGGGAGAVLAQIIYDLKPVAPKAAARSSMGARNSSDRNVDFLKQPLKWMTLLPDVSKEIPPMLRTLVDPRISSDLVSRTSPKTPINRAISSERSFAGISLSLAISSGALRRYLIAENALPTTSMTAFVPISLCKPGDTTQENQVMAMISSLASDIEDPKARHVASAVDAKRSEKLINPLRTMMPLEPRRLYPISIAARGLGLNITVSSYRDELEVAVRAATTAVVAPLSEAADAS